MKNILIGLLMIGTLFGQVNSVLQFHLLQVKQYWVTNHLHLEIAQSTI